MNGDVMREQSSTNGSEQPALEAWQKQWTQSTGSSQHTAPPAAPVAVLPQGTALTGITEEERHWAALAHGSAVLNLLVGLSTAGIGSLFMLLVPLGIYLSYRDRSAYVARQAMQAFAFQTATLALFLLGVILLVPLWTVTGLLTIVLVGLLLLPVALLLSLVVVALPLIMAGYGAYAALETLNGQPFRYRWIANWVDRQGWGSRRP